MAKENEHIDQLFKEGIRKEYPYDENLWSKVSNQLPKTNGKSWGIGRYVSVIIMISILSFSVISLSDKSDQQNQYAIDVYESEGSNIERNYSENVFYTELSAFQRKNIAQAKEVEQRQKHGNKLSQSPNSKIAKTAKSQKATEVGNASAEANVGNHTATNMTMVQDDEEQFDIPTTVKQNNNVSQNDFAETGFTREKSINKNIALVNAATNTVETSKGEVAESNISNLQLINSKKANSEGKLLASDLTDQLGDFEFLEPKGLLTIQGTAESLQSIKEKETKTYPWQKADNPFLFEIEYRRSLELAKKFEVDNEKYREYKQNFEKPMHQYSFGINASKRYKNFIYGLGLHYESIGEDISLRTESVNLKFDTSYTMINPSYNHNGELIYIIRRDVDSIATTSYGKQINNFTKISRIQLPIFVGYKISYSIWTIEARTGLSIGYLVESSGAYLSSDFANTVELNRGNVSEFQFSHQLQLRISYAMNEYTSIGIGGDYRYELNSSLKIYDNRFNSFGGILFIQVNPFK